MALTPSLRNRVTITGATDFDRDEGGRIVFPQGTAFPASPETGEVFYRTDQEQIYRWTGATWQPEGGTGIQGNLNNAYDFGGPGAGRQIGVDAGLPVQLSGPGGEPSLEITGWVSFVNQNFYIGGGTHGVPGARAIGIGHNTSVAGVDGVAIGHGASAPGDGGVALGANASAAAGGVALGSGASAPANEFVISSSLTKVNLRSTELWIGATPSAGLVNQLLSSQGPGAAAEWVTARVVGEIVEVNAATYTVQINEDFILVAYSLTGNCTINLPPVSTHITKRIVVKDKGFNAFNNPITINPNGAETIDGFSSFIVTEDGYSVTLVGSGTEWSVV